MKIREKNSQGKVVKQYILNKNDSAKQLKTLDDAKSIVSHNS